MIKFVLLFILSLSLYSCGKKTNSSSAVEESIFDLGPDEFPPGESSDKVITQNNESHVPMNLLSQDLTMTFDPVSQKVTGHSVIKFRVGQYGRPYFELKASLSNIRINNSSAGATSIKDPDGQNQSYWSLNQELDTKDIHEVEFDYDLPAGRVSYINGGVRFLTDMTDLNGKFFENWGPVGFEEDAFTLRLKLEVKNGSSSHKLFTNGEIASSEASSWLINFPNYYTKSSFYVHLTNQTDLPVKNFVYKGLEKDIPIQVYGVTSALVDSAVSQLPKLFKELEGDYGAYPHNKFLAYMNDRSGGMEYVAATITSLGSLDHELLHSWFARSVIPADGRSGWIDEAMASWRDYGYTRAKSTLNRTPTNLANYSPFRKSTPSNSYVDGRGLMAELDLVFASIGGLKPIMNALFKKYKNNIIANEDFWSFLESYSKLDLEPFQVRYAMGNLNVEETVNDKSVKQSKFSPLDHSKHPDPLTDEEILKLR